MGNIKSAFELGKISISFPSCVTEQQTSSLELLFKLYLPASVPPPWKPGNTTEEQSLSCHLLTRDSALPSGR